MAISLIRTVIIYILIIFAVRIMGKRQISELQTTELVVTLLIADLAIIPMQDNGQPLTSGIIPIFVLIALEIFVSIIMLKNGKLRKFVCGKPMLVIEKGKVLQSEMKELRMSTEDLLESLRQKDIFDINEVKYAIVETNGVMSVMKKEEFETVQNKDLPIKQNDESLKVIVVSDGEICYHSLKLCSKNERKIMNILKNEKLNLDDIYIMICDESENYTIIKKEN